MSGHLDRRSFLVSLGAAWIVGCSASDTGPGDPLPFDEKARKMTHALGHHAKNGNLPEGRDALLAALTSHASLPSGGDEAGIAAALDAQITRDFEAEDTEKVGGWVLSKTEALVAAALATKAGV